MRFVIIAMVAAVGVGCTEDAKRANFDPPPSDATPGESVEVTTDPHTTTDETDTDPDYIGFPWVEFDCAAGQPDPPFDAWFLEYTDSSEDISFSLDGYLLMNKNNDVARYSYNGSWGILSGGFNSPTGLATLPDGDLAIADRYAGRVTRWHAGTGALEVVAGNVAYPNGIEVAPDGSLYVTDSNSGSVWWVEPDTGDSILITDQIYGADGISFNPDYNLLYVGSIHTGDIHTIEVLGPGADHGPPTPWIAGLDRPWGTADGIQVDRCGYVYVADLVDAIWRVDPVTRDAVKVIDAPRGLYLPAMRFGSGVGEWDAMHLYVSTYEEVIEVAVGVPNKARWPAVWP